MFNPEIKTILRKYVEDFRIYRPDNRGIIYVETYECEMMLLMELEECLNRSYSLPEFKFKRYIVIWRPLEKEESKTEELSNETESCEHKDDSCAVREI